MKLRRLLSEDKQSMANLQYDLSQILKKYGQEIKKDLGPKGSGVIDHIIKAKDLIQKLSNENR